MCLWVDFECSCDWKKTLGATLLSMKEDMVDGGGVSSWCLMSSFEGLGCCLTILKEAL